MNKLLFYISFSFLLFAWTFTNSFAQINLVPNGSFEEHDTCPSDWAQFNYVKYWYSPINTTPDYFNTCSPLICSTPQNMNGYQVPKVGNGYAGIVIYSYKLAETDWLEYIQVKLNEKLVKGKNYKFSFSISIAENESTYAVNLISAVLSDSPITSFNNISPILTTPTFTYNQFILDTLNWIDLSWDYIANGNEEYLTIGNFISSNSIDTLNINSEGLEPVSYLFIDNVALFEYPDLISYSNVFTPNNDGFNDYFMITFIGKIGHIMIYNRWGNKVFEQQAENKIEWDGTKINESPCTEGTYFYVIYFSDNTKTTGSIQLLR